MRLQHLTLPPYHSPHLILKLERLPTAPSFRLVRIASGLLLAAAFTTFFILALRDIQRLHSQVDRISSFIGFDAIPISGSSESTNPPIYNPPKPSGTIEASPSPPAPNTITITPPQGPSDDPSPDPLLPSSLYSDLPESYFPPIPFPDGAFDELPNMVQIPATTITLTTLSATPTDLYYSNPTGQAGALASSLGGLMIESLRDPLAYLLHLAKPRVFVQKLWGLIIMLFNYPA